MLCYNNNMRTCDILFKIEYQGNTAQLILVAYSIRHENILKNFSKNETF